MEKLEKFKQKSDNAFGWIKKHFVFGIIAAAAVLALIVSLTTTLLFYGGKVAPRTTIAGVSVSGQDKQQLKRTLQNMQEKIKLQISYDNKDVTADTKDLGIIFDIDRTIDTALKTSQENIFARLFASKQIDLVASYSSKTAGEFINKNFPELTTDPIDAQVVYDAKQNQFVVQPGAVGKSIDAKNLDTTIQSLIKNPRAERLALKITAAEPTIETAGAEKAAEAANTRLALALNISNNGRLIWTIDPPDIAAWTTFTSNTDSGRYIVSYDKSKVVDLINTHVASEVADKPINERAITDSAGNILQVVSPGKNGQAPTNVNQVAGQIVAALDNSVSEDFNLVTNDATFKIDKTVAANGHWIEANLSDFSVKLYDGTSVVWQTNQTAHGKASTPTITGLFTVFSKVFNQCMPNPGPNGEPAPDLCNIHYVTYWGAGGYAFHEAWWLTPGKVGTGISHGCINMYQADAKVVYDFASIGTPVWVHY